MKKLIGKLAKLGPPDTISLALERPSGLLVDTLLEAGVRVVPIHPNVIKASRSRYSAARAKRDPGDAYLLADLLRTDGHRFRALRTSSDETRALRALVRARDELVAERVALANQLRALLESIWPGAACIFAAVDSMIGLAFLEQYPTPRHAQTLAVQQLETFLKQHAYSGRRSALALLERLQVVPEGKVGQVEAETKGKLVQSLALVLIELVTQIQGVTAALGRWLEAHPDGRLIASFPRAGRVNAAQILAELGDERGRFISADHLAAEPGVAPVTHASGKHRGVVFRRACNKRLRRAVTCFADNSKFQARVWVGGERLPASSSEGL